MKPCADRQDDLATLAMTDPWLAAHPEVREHVDRCPGCRSYLLELTETMARLSAADAPPVDPPPALKDALLAGIKREVAGNGFVPSAARHSAPRQAAAARTPVVATPWYGRWVAVALIALLLLNGLLLGGYFQLQAQVAALTRMLEVGGSQMAVAYDLMELMAVPSDLSAELVATDAAPDAAGRVALYRTGNGLLVVVSVWGLPELADRRHVYQLWLNDEERKLNGGVFRVDPSGRGALIHRAAGEDIHITTIGVTLEPDPFGDAPRGRQVLSAQLAP